MEVGFDIKRHSNLTHGDTTPLTGQATNVNKDGTAHVMLALVQVKTPKDSRRAIWEAFHAQFKLLTMAQHWLEESRVVVGHVSHRRCVILFANAGC